MVTFEQIGEIAFPIVYKAVDALKADQNHYYGLLYNVDYGVIKTKHFPAFDYEDDWILVKKVDEERSHWWLKSFEPESKAWDGTTFLPDKGTNDLDALFKASLFHDVGYERAKAISKATGIPLKSLLAFFDDCLRILSQQYGARPLAAKSAWFGVRLGGRTYHTVKGWLKPLLLIGALFVCGGCYSLQTEIENETPPEIQWTGPWFANR